MAHDAFISCASKDKPIADAVCARLESRGIRCWVAPRDVRAGRSYGEEIIDAIHTSKVMVLVLSANANASPHIPKEIERAVSNGIPVIPLRIENVMPAKSLDYFISSVHWLDAITPPLDQHLDHLATTINAVLDRPNDSPPIPPSQQSGSYPVAPPSGAYPVAPNPATGSYPTPPPPAPAYSGRRIFCTKCGSENAAEAYSCTRCGKELRPPQQPAAYPVVAGAPLAANTVPNYLVHSIVVTLLCCLPGGIAAIIYASKVNQKLALGDLAGAQEASKNAKMWCWISFGVGLVVLFFYAVGTIAELAKQSQ